MWTSPPGLGKGHKTNPLAPDTLRQDGAPWKTSSVKIQSEIELFPCSSSIMSQSSSLYPQFFCGWCELTILVPFMATAQKSRAKCAQCPWKAHEMHVAHKRQDVRWRGDYKWGNFSRVGIISRISGDLNINEITLISISISIAISIISPSPLSISISVL